MYEFSRGPLVWIALLSFFAGSIYRMVSTIRMSKKDKVVLPYMHLKFSLRSIFRWILPFSAVNMRRRIPFTTFSIFFHISLFLLPLFTLGHVVLFEESWGMSWFHLPDTVSKALTIFVVTGGFIFLLRRTADPTIYFVSSATDFLIPVLMILPFLTGLLASLQLFNYKIMILLHIWSGAIWLVTIPLTRLTHMHYFPLTRGYMGCEFGFVRNARDW